MIAAPSFIVVENRRNKALEACVQSALNAGEKLIILAGTDPGAEYETFAKQYVHLSSNSAAFEIICFRRYFLIENYLKATPACKRFVLVDSDVLLFRGIGEHFRGIGAKGASFAGSAIVAPGWDPRQISPHASYWTREALRGFLDYILKIYQTPSGIEQLEKINNQFKQRGYRGGVSDMTLLYLWAHEERHVVHSNKKGALGVVDHNINLPHNHAENEFKMRGGAKRLNYRHGKPYLTTREGQRIPALALHFQGASKIVMRNALLGQQWRFTCKSLCLLWARNIKQLVFGFQSRNKNKPRLLPMGGTAPAAEKGGQPP